MSLNNRALTIYEVIVALTILMIITPIAQRGYTHIVKNQKRAALKEYALQCASNYMEGLKYTALTGRRSDTLSYNTTFGGESLLVTQKLTSSIEEKGYHEGYIIVATKKDTLLKVRTVLDSLEEGFVW